MHNKYNTLLSTTDCIALLQNSYIASLTPNVIVFGDPGF